MMTNNIVFDMTTLVLWNRPPVGIVRTQLEIADYLFNHHENTIFFKFNSSRDSISQMNLEEVRDVILKLRNNNFKNNNYSGNNKLGCFKKFNHKIKSFNKRNIIIVLKMILPSKMVSFLKKIKNKKIKNNKVSNQQDYLDKNIQSIVFCPEIYLAQNMNIQFINKNSIVISVGLDWDNSNYPLLYWLKKKIGFKFIGVFYDGISIFNPELVQSDYFSKKFFWHVYYLVYLCDKIFCISNFSKKQLEDIIKEHNFSSKPLLKTLYLGDSINISDDKGIKCRQLSKKYILYVSTVEIRKNHILLLKVWDYLISKYHSDDIPDLICVGMFGWGINELMEYYNSNERLRKKVKFYNDVSDAELSIIYQNAMFTVFPSFVEGWGLGAVESLMYNKPCIVSDCPALVEATRGLMPCISPNNLDGWCKMIEKWIFDKKVVSNYKEIINSKFEPRSWTSFCEDFINFSGN